MKIRFFLLSIFILALSSCSSFGNKFDAARAKKIHKVAIVAIEIHQQKAADNFKIGAIMQLKDGNPGDSPELQNMARKIFDNLATQLQKKTGWQVLSIDQMVSNSEYKKKYDKDMTGARRVLTTSDDMETIYPKQILDVMSFRKMSLEERAAMAKSLGVDAVAEVIVTNSIEQSMYSLGHIMGHGDFSFVGHASLQIFDFKSEDPIWRSQNMTGEKTKSSEAFSANSSKLEKLSRLGEEASVSAIQKLVQSYPL